MDGGVALSCRKLEGLPDQPLGGHGVAATTPTLSDPMLPSNQLEASTAKKLLAVEPSPLLLELKEVQLASVIVVATTVADANPIKLLIQYNWKFRKNR
ncbi:unnamed protein product [Linum trigynum]|uniref:Uncharacterized protein n=1 Tax=Linum trigynum TaxID=586398 RepID=A0AAV2CSU2_9ROSI